MKAKKILIHGLAAVLAMAAVAQPGLAFARGERGGERGARHEDSRSRHYPQHGRSAFWLPRSSVSISVAGLSFFYGDGVFYRRSGPRYVVVAPPYGAVVTWLPSGYQTVVINGITYYNCEDVYYQRIPNGYVVVQPPVVAPAGSTCTVDVPNYRGGYTRVVLRRAGEGYFGPHGEYYYSFPSGGQLQAMYGNR